VEDNRDGASEGGMEKERADKNSSILIARVASISEIQRRPKLTLGVDTKKLYLFARDGRAIG